MQDLPDKLRRVVSETGMTQKELAAKLGVSQPTISRLYRGSPIRGGPAHRRMAERLSELDEGALVNSFIQNIPEWPPDAHTMPAPKSSREAKALDNLIRALNEYVDARREAKS